MSALGTSLIVLVAALHLWFLVLEMFLWTRPIGRGAFHPDTEVGRQSAVFFLACVVVAGCFGAVTASKRILYVQAVPALVALVVVLLRY